MRGRGREFILASNPLRAVAAWCAVLKKRNQPKGGRLAQRAAERIVGTEVGGMQQEPETVSVDRHWLPWISTVLRGRPERIGAEYGGPKCQLDPRDAWTSARILRS
jgi:hypothetical protein